MKLKLLLFDVESPIVLRDTFVSGSTLLHAIFNRLTQKQAKDIKVSTLRLFVPYKKRGKMVPYKKDEKNKEKELIKIETYSELRDWRMGRPLEGDTEQASKLDIHFRYFNSSRYYDPNKTDPPFMVISNEAGFVNNADEEMNDKNIRKVQVTAYIHGCTDVDDEVFQGISIGAKRNLGFGRLNLIASKVIDTDDIEMDVESDWVYLMSPFCIESDFPGSEGTGWPKWWSADGWRKRYLKLFHTGRLYDLQCVDEDQVFHATDKHDAWEGVGRFGNHSKYGFGEWYFAGGPVASVENLSGEKTNVKEKVYLRTMEENEKEVIIKTNNMKVNVLDFF